MTDGLFHRESVAGVQRALSDTPVVLLNGPRQCGKTTLVRKLVGGDRQYLTLDDPNVLAVARADPVGFIRGLDRVAIDEIQRAPDLLPAIKLAVDGDRRPGRFLLTGSANVLTLPTVAESLAGRMAVIDLLPLAGVEIAGRRPGFLESAFAGQPPPPDGQATLGEALAQMVLTGGYPEMLARSDAGRRQAWARDYVRAIVQRDVRDIAGVERLATLPRLLRVFAQHAAQLVNFSQVGSQLGLDSKTVQRYLGIFEQLFLLRRVDPWHSNRLSRLIKTPKLHFLDSGLLASLRGSARGGGEDRTSFGALLETYVFGEILKHASWMPGPIEVFHFRDRAQNEVDFVLEDEAGAVIGIEVKASATVTVADFRGLKRLAEAAGPAFRAGYVLYDGDRNLPFGAGFTALPLSVLQGQSRST